MNQTKKAKKSWRERKREIEEETLAQNLALPSRTKRERAKVLKSEKVVKHCGDVLWAAEDETSD